MRTLKYWSVLGILTALLFSSKVNAQIVCPPNDATCPWVTFSESQTFGTCTINWTVRMRLCAGVLQYQYTSMSTSGDCSFWKDSTIQQILDLFVMQKAMGDASFGSLPGYSIPFCPTTQQQVQFFTSSCYIWQKCTYNTTAEAPVCDPPENNPGVPPTRKVDTWTRHDCGISCCKRTYEVCVTPSTTGGDLHSNPTDLARINVRLLTRERIIPCTKNTDGTWTTRPCNDGC